MELIVAARDWDPPAPRFTAAMMAEVRIGFAEWVWQHARCAGDLAIGARKEYQLLQRTQRVHAEHQESHAIPPKRILELPPCR
jgi:hypothetical protein